MREIKKEGKSHNEDKSGNSADRHYNIDERKRMLKEKRSAQVDRERRMLVALVICVIVGIQFAFVYKSNNKKKNYEEQTDICENGEYVGEREVGIKELSNAEKREEKEDKLPEFNIYEETADMDVEKRFGHYKKVVEKIIYPENIRSSSVVKELTEDGMIKDMMIDDKKLEADIMLWHALNYDIGVEEEKKGDADNVADLTTLKPKDYRDIYKLCYQAYCIFPQADMATRYGRNAGDALKTSLDNGEYSYSQLITDFNISNEGYVTSFHYRDCSQKLADGCYWAGDNFNQFLHNYPEVSEQDKEHCALMTYFYSFFGSNVSGEEGVQHRNDLKKIQKEAKRILMEEYNYPESLFNEE